jgi:hypothetical protein
MVKAMFLGGIPFSFTSPVATKPVSRPGLAFSASSLLLSSWHWWS